MMAQSTLFIYLVTVLFITDTLSYCSAEIVYCVTPTATSCSSCPHNSTYCATLSEYVRETKKYFTSDTTMVFLSGGHTLDSNITVANVARLTMRGESFSGNRATIACNGPFGLSFTSMAEFKIHSLAFTSCNRKYRGTYRVSNYALLLHSTHAEFLNCSFHDNPSTALVVNNTNITLTGNTEFIRNHWCIGGGICAVNSNLTFTGNTTFLGNKVTDHVACHSHGRGGAIYAVENTVLHFYGTSNFTDNYALFVGGAIMTSQNTVLILNGTNNFIRNSADLGGAIYTSDSKFVFDGTNNFVNNSAYLNGGAFDTGNVKLFFSGTSNFINNSVKKGAGGAIYTLKPTEFSFSGTNNFDSNSAEDGGAIFTSKGTAVRLNGTSKFINNYAVYGGAIRTFHSSTLALSGTIHFTNNRGETNTPNAYNTSGGGVYMGLKSNFSILPNTTVYWENNHARLGGAIYVEDTSPLSYCTTVAALIPKEDCFFQLPGQNLSNGNDVQLVFKNNSADIAGSVLYGGAIDNCKLVYGLDSEKSGHVFDMIAHDTTSKISSNPFYMCSCSKNNLPVCSMNVWFGSQHHFPRTVYPGETIQYSVVATGQRKGKLPSTVRSIITTPNSGLLDSQYLQQAYNTCTKLHYTIFSLSNKVFIKLQAEGSPCSNIIYTMLSVNLHQVCPPGFKISTQKKSCVCEPRLANYTNQCTIKNGVGRITRDSDEQFWVGYDNQTDGLILHSHCPFGYCVSHKVVFPLNNTDMQCAPGRSGLLCGHCKEGYSLVLGTSQCKQCTDINLVLLVPFAVMGVVLVFLLFVCKLTVATGTVSGLVFYANIVGINRATFLSANPVLSVFIAWLNLDLGIETCFYNGMDAYSKTWLQFVFPLYIWLLVGLMIFVSNFSRRFAKLLGKNPVSVLATLILLSYTKILRTLIAAIHITFLQYTTYNRMVWIYDANVDYLSGKHIPLFLVAVLVFLFLFLPYTLLLLFGQWLQAISHLRLFSWVNSARLKPFMDSYHAPYKAQHRYWPGLLLVLRFVSLLVVAFNFQEDPKTNLLAILIEVGNLFLWLWISGGVYTNRCLNVLEGSFALNLIVLTAVTYCVNLFEGNQLIAEYTWTISVSVAFATFIGILAIQLANMTGITRYLKRKYGASKLVAVIQTEAEPNSPTDSLPDRLINPEEYESPFPHTIAEPADEADETQKRLLSPVYTYGSIS